jgi:hypothetical protein
MKAARQIHPTNSCFVIVGKLPSPLAEILALSSVIVSGIDTDAGASHFQPNLETKLLNSARVE